MSSLHFSTALSEDTHGFFACAPALGKFVSEVNRAACQPDASDINRLREPFNELLCSSFVGDLVNCELSALQSDSGRVSPGLFNNVWEVWKDDRWALTVRVQRPNLSAPSTSMLSTSPQDSLLGVANDASLRVHLYRTAEEFDCCIVKKHLPLEKMGEKILRRGDVVLIRASKDVFEIERHAELSVLCTLAVNPTEVMTQLFDRTTLAPQLAVAANLRDSRLEVAALVLANLGHREAIPQMEALLQHKAHFVRWAMLRGIAALDVARALPHLKAAIDDPHPHLRVAAARSLRVVQSSGIEV